RQTKPRESCSRNAENLAVGGIPNQLSGSVSGNVDDVVALVRTDHVVWISRRPRRRRVFGFSLDARRSVRDRDEVRVPGWFLTCAAIMGLTRPAILVAAPGD